MTSARVLLSVVVLVAAGGARVVPGVETRRALLVGIDTYAPLAEASSAPDSQSGGSGRALAWTNLEGAVRDVEAVRSILIARHGFLPADIQVLTNSAATRDAILGAIRAHLKTPSKAGDVALFFYAGHGSRVRNSRSTEPDGMDETLVPADANRGARDIRDKELARAFNDVLDTGASFTAIFDSCHSGSIARGLPSAVRARSLPADMRDIAAEIGPDPVDPRGEPEQRGALVLSAAQDTQSAGETQDAQGDWHGLFSHALAEALRAAPVNEPADLLFRRIEALMSADAQIPVLAGRGREKRPLFGAASRALDGRILVPVERMGEDGRVVLLGGAALALGPGSELERSGEGRGKLKARIRIEEVEGLARSRASVVRADSACIRTGDLFELVRWVAPDEALLRIWLPPSLAVEDLQRAVLTLGALCGATEIECVADPTETTPTHVVSWNGAEWRLAQGGKDLEGLGAVLTEAHVRDAIARSGTGDARLFVHLPPPPRLLEALGPSTAEPGAVAIVESPAAADYYLVGRSSAGRLEYAWLRPNLTRADAGASPLPLASDWFSLRDPPDSLESDARLLRERALRLARVAGWLRLRPPPDDGTFPYRLKLRNTKTGTEVSAGTVRDGETYALVLEARPEDLTPPLARRFVYVFSIDAHGGRTLLFPRSGQGNVENRLPWAGPPGAPAPEGFPTSIELTRSGAFRVGPPFGVDTFVLLTSREPVDPAVLEEEGARTRGSGAEPDPPSPLTRLLASVGSASRGVQLATPADWSVERIALRSVSAQGDAPSRPGKLDQEAVRVLEDAAARWPTDSVVQTDLGSAYLRSGRIDEGLRILTHAVKVSGPEAGPTLRFAETHLDDALQDHPMLLRHPACTGGVCEFPRKRPPADATSFDGPGLGPATPARLGEVAFQALYAAPPRLEESERLYREAIAANDRLSADAPDRLEGEALAGLFEGVGMTALLRGRCAEAAEAFRSATVLEPAESGLVAESHYNLARSLALCRRTSEALAALRRATELQGSYGERARQDDDLAVLRNHPEFRVIVGLGP